MPEKQSFSMDNRNTYDGLGYLNSKDTQDDTQDDAQVNMAQKNTKTNAQNFAVYFSCFRNGCTGERDRKAESGGSNGTGRADEQPSQQSGRNRKPGIDLCIINYCLQMKSGAVCSALSTQYDNNDVDGLKYLFFRE